MKKNNLRIKKSRTGIKKKLERFITTLTVDPFGYEKNIKINVLRFFSLVAKEELLSQNRLTISIYIHDDNLYGFLDSHMGITRILSRKEISELFTGETTPNAWILDKIKKCIYQISLENSIPDNQLEVLIKIVDCTPTIEFYDVNGYLKDLPIKELVRLVKSL
ncbi:hypothetical protein [Flavilitoribacter nigricans]|uniref:Uncharacterized protein n=1 Tax=Flavilitoribacter nigricans (strain ATCC 23147 / DSM 23189 / NBRC 102662 / NCIMB 1420 / SS-2) TaxID=1122177 RepID=A0A2D0NJQ3_FLAN2|nr:hypothetical protein [Flavilitoribacter nigricans]PHN08687.1 hypothetical protein CRP01_01890 [Flavilitoribacter nigricans DSM 23189 = NBRC 102662]